MPDFTAVTAYLRDLAERVGSTFVAAFGAALVANWTGVIPSDWKAWLTTGVLAGAVSAAKGLLAKLSGDPATASLLPSLITRKAN